MSDKRVILLVDDDVNLQQLVKLALQSRGYKVETANDGWEALERLKTLTPNLIVLDLTMPKMGGLVFYSKICDNSNRPKYPILILSARAYMEKLFQDFIIDGFMTKPFEIDEFLDKVDSIINKRFGALKIIKVAGEERAARVCIVDNDPPETKKISDAFLACGYVVDCAFKGSEAVEHVYTFLPDVVVINLNLPDIGGDDIIVQLKGMDRTKNVKFLLYMNQLAEKTIVIDKISQKEGIDLFIDFVNVQQLVTGANELLKQYAVGDTG